MHDYIAAQLIRSREDDVHRSMRRARVDRERSWSTRQAGRALRAGLLGAVSVVSAERAARYES
jgi:hypothetical protein